MKFERVLSFFGFDLVRENADLRRRNASLVASLELGSYEQNRLKELVGDMTREIGMWRAKVRLLESEVCGRDGKIGDLHDDIAALTHQLVEASGALEQANSQIAVLQQQLRAEDGDEQLALMNAPAAADNGEVADALVQNVTQEVVYRLVGPWLEGEKHFWTFALGSMRMTARIHDKSFLEKMARREVFFAAGDAVRMTLRTVTYRKPDGALYAKYSVERVIGVVPPEKQLDIPALAQPTPAEGVTP